MYGWRESDYRGQKWKYKFWGVFMKKPIIVASTIFLMLLIFSSMSYYKPSKRSEEIKKTITQVSNFEN